ncbi:MAG: hypothetical protein GJ676_03375 [Rhodobacteraceae bacterium]|nr:hypothetical protein [Paracoccaceae bacterium]
MLWDELAMAGSAALAQVLTNLDNLAVLLVLQLTLGAGRTTIGYVLSQAIMLTAALAVAIGADRTLPDWSGYLGLVPLALGLRGIWLQWSSAAEESPDTISRKAGILGVTFLFLGLSFDSFSVMAPLLADSLPAYRPWALAGASLAVLGLVTLARGVASSARTSPKWALRLERLGPVAMIAVGIYVLFNSGTDQI